MLVRGEYHQFRSRFGLTCNGSVSAGCSSFRDNVGRKDVVSVFFDDVVDRRHKGLVSAILVLDSIVLQIFSSRVCVTDDLQFVYGEESFRCLNRTQHRH